MEQLAYITRSGMAWTVWSYGKKGIRRNATFERMWEAICLCNRINKLGATE